MIARRPDVRLGQLLALALLACLLAGAAAAAIGSPGPKRSSASGARALTRFQGESAAQALTTLRRAFPAQVGPAFRAFSSDTKLVQKLNSHQVIVADSSGRRSLAVGVLPLFGTTASGQSAPVDLSLLPRGGGWVPRSSLIPISLPGRSGGPVSFTGQPWGLRFASGRSSEGRRVSGSVFFGNVGGRARSTDAVLRPIPLGASVSFVSRGPASPLARRLQFGLPAGWRLARSRALPGTLQIISAGGQARGLIGPVVATDSRGRRIAVHYAVQKRTQVRIALPHSRAGFTYPIVLTVPVIRLGLSSWSSSPVAWHATTSSADAFLSHRAYGEYGVWSGTARHHYPVATWGQYSAAAPAGAYVYKVVESGVTHTSGDSAEFGGIHRPGAGGWETSGTWRGPGGSGGGAHRAEPRTLSNAMYTYCARPSCAPDSSIATGNSAVFGLQMLGHVAPRTRPVALMENATLYESDTGPVSLSTPSHSGYVPGTWVNNATDSVTATASEANGLGIYREVVIGGNTRLASSFGPMCDQAGPAPCPLRYTGRMTYSTAGMSNGRHTVWEAATDAGGMVSHVSTWSVNVDHRAPTLALSGQLASENGKTLSSGQYPLAVSAADTNGSTPTSGLARISVLVDGKPASGLSGFSGCSFGAQCGSSAAVHWTLTTSQFPSGTHTIVVQAVDSARNTTSSSLKVTIPASSSPPPSGGPNMYWGATIGTQFTGSEPPFDWNAETDFANLDAGGKLPSIVSWGQPFNASAYCNSSSPYPAGHYCTFPTSVFNSVRQHGYIPMLSWSSQEVGNYFAPSFMDGAIASGSQDAYLTQWAKDAKAWGHPLFLRFDWEMNGSWFNYGTGKHSSTSTPNNTPAQFVAMWRHVHNIFTQVGATNVTWLWCSNAEFALGSSPASNYPGDSYVDWTCFDGYNGDDPWKSFTTLSGQTYNDIAALAPSKPMMLGETASTAVGGSKAQWISGMFSALAGSYPKLQGVVWEDIDSVGPGGKSDWPVEGPNPRSPDTASINAFTTGVKNARYKTNTYSQLNTSPIPAP